MIRSISQNYSKSIYFEDYSNELFSLIENTHKSLLDLNINLIFLCEKLNIELNFSLSSNLKLTSSKEELILDICKLKKAKKYISTIGAKNYLNEENFKKKQHRIKFF